MKPETRALYTEIADYMEKLPITSWDYGNWFVGGYKKIDEIYKHPCGSTGCVWGWSKVVIAKKLGLDTEEFRWTLQRKSPSQVAPTVEDFLELAYSERDYLFYGHFSHLGTESSLKQVVSKLRRIAETGLIKDPEYDFPFSYTYAKDYWENESKVEARLRYFEQESRI